MLSLRPSASSMSSIETGSAGAAGPPLPTPGAPSHSAQPTLLERTTHSLKTRTHSAAMTVFELRKEKLRLFLRGRQGWDG
eukprot:scaffold102773_cov27-Phaeocystis_antarctica.AAC.2